jgi:hypothetical protein
MRSKRGERGKGGRGEKRRMENRGVRAEQRNGDAASESLAV